MCAGNSATPSPAATRPTVVATSCTARCVEGVTCASRQACAGGVRQCTATPGQAGHEKRVTGDVAQIDPVAVRHRMAVGHEGDHRHPIDDGDLEIVSRGLPLAFVILGRMAGRERAVGGEVHETGIGATREDPVRHLVPIGCEQVEHHIRPLVAQVAEHAGQQRCRERGHERESQPCARAEPDAADRLCHRVDVAEEPSSVVGQLDAGLGQLDAAPVPGEQRDAEFPFERAQLRAERRLREMQASGPRLIDRSSATTTK